MADETIPALLVTAIPNVRYLTGFEDAFDDHAEVALLVTGEIARVYTDFRYREAAEVAAQATAWAVHVPPKSLYEDLCRDVADLGAEMLAVEASVPYGRFRFISEHCSGKVEVLDQWVNQARRVKEQPEIERIAAAAALTDRAFDHILGRLAVGMRESEIALELEVYMRTNGSVGLAFEPIVASGPNSSRPHARVTGRKLAEGDFVTLDLGARVEGYCSDMTRTVVMGQASDRQREIYEAVLQANRVAIEAARPGMSGTAIDSVARESLASAGFGEYFGHGLGHGVGLEVHELPSVGPRGTESVLAGAVITIEPGVYVAGFGGVRIEDLVVMEGDGCRLLSHAPKQLIEI
jgi:Xaa-Pro aminopeptidase